VIHTATSAYGRLLESPQPRERLPCISDANPMAHQSNELVGKCCDTGQMGQKVKNGAFRSEQP
jgi:hypothetical protein